MCFSSAWFGNITVRHQSTWEMLFVHNSGCWVCHCHRRNFQWAWIVHVSFSWYILRQDNWILHWNYKLWGAGLTFATHSKEGGFLFGTLKLALRFEEGFAFSSVDQSEFKFPQFWLTHAGERSGIVMPMAQCEGGFDDLKGFFQHKPFHDSTLCVSYTAEGVSALLSDSPS